MTLTKEAVLDRLKDVKDPELGKGLVELGMIRDVEVAGPAVRVTVALTMAACPMKTTIRDDVERAVRGLEGVEHVEVVLTAMTSEERARLFGREPSEMEGMKAVRRVLAVASGKGGVGKTTVTVNLSLALARKGHRVGILDADLHGPDIPLMLGITERPLGSGGMLLPVERHGLKVMSTGMLAGEGVPIIWRGALVNKAVKEFFGRVRWGELDFLVVDLPPGTGDAPLTLVQSIPMAGVVMVTTPQKVALSDVRRAFGLFRAKEVPVLGVVENMSFLRVPGSDQVMEVFGSGGGEKLAKAFKVPLLGKIPLDPAIREAGDAGRPAVLDEGSEAARAFDEVAERLLSVLPAVGEKEQ
ncbi:Mrp/NBP35 family ATP-binding protein [Dissulfurirhabdus thermomarina]|uniref:Iron-sulfur cluster carrier protein n=1 Tax=Dissulfurirhabdus thermomarina TaxID=1765737 RepID=A0A6N9TM92_DISTH|nr:Mrp/NBP35 family ATP-binding protein [Dissulfurirhabdus thermomarina]NDY42239.1 Mrp/NBP35 family ATP-binding protein [Dissulfurirhabdus thermomarina]NMX23165.1 Mrp/NBP35 family ATP-binding protein [Dissulfurirhabdus thermomarina]